MVNIIMDAMMNPIKLNWKAADYAATATTFRPDQAGSSTQTEHRKTFPHRHLGHFSNPCTFVAADCST
jgi:hypothetical protein